MQYIKEDNPLVQQSATDYKQFKVYEEIKNDILNNTYPVGTVMIERKLCEIYNVSRSPIRKALHQLSHEGLLYFVPGKVIIVPEFKIEDILEVYDLIELLQTFAIGSCIAKDCDIAIETLNDILKKMKISLDEGNLVLAANWDQKFHKFIIDFSGNNRLISIFESLHNQSMRFQASTLEDESLSKQSYFEHLDLYENIKQKKTKEAQESIKTHYHNIKQYYINRLLVR